MTIQNFDKFVDKTLVKQGREVFEKGKSFFHRRAWGWAMGYHCDRQRLIRTGGVTT